MYDDDGGGGTVAITTDLTNSRQKNLNKIRNGMWRIEYLHILSIQSVCPGLAHVALLYPGRERNR